MAIRAYDEDRRRRAGGRNVRVGGTAALIVALLLLLGVIGLAVSSARLGLRNWLVVLFQINSGQEGLPSQALQIVNSLDVAILVLAAVSFAGFWPGPGRPHRAWTAIGIALPLLGIPLLLVTHESGRSGVLSGGVVMAVLMLTSRGFVSLGIVGLLANVLLLIGDFATSDSRAPVVAAVMAAGYALLVVWFVAIGVHLLGGHYRRSPRTLTRTTSG